MAEGEYRPPGGGEAGNQSTPVEESRVLSIISGLQQEEGQTLDPYRVSDALLSYRDRKSAHARGLTLMDGWLTETREPAVDEEAMLEILSRVHHAFDIIAYSRFPESYQKILSAEVHGSSFPYLPSMKTQQGEFTLTPAEKHILTQIASVSGVPDNPDQLTYSFSSIPRTPTTIESTIE